jgi:DNA polymerase-3 subunit chi
MTEVSFHFNAPDRLGHACRLLRKAYSKGVRMLVLVEPHELTALDAALWQRSTHDFLPHSTDQDPAHVRAHSPIQLCSGPVSPSGPRGASVVLLNLRHEMPADFLTFSKVIEVVTQGDDDRQQARERWRLYRQSGIEPLRHDLQSSAST